MHESLEQPLGPPAQLMLARILEVLSDPITISERAYKQRLDLMEIHEAMAEVGLPFECVTNAGEVYMHCSYTDAPNKHAIKRTVNKWYREFALQSIDVPECDRKPEWKERPKVIIPLEWFSTNHSMFRCYAPALRSLRAKFEVVGMYGGEASDADAEQVFERVIHLPGDELQFTQIAEIIHAEAPDVILFPSIGMASWCIALSNLRLAPLQIMCPGHPASSQSDYIDYLIAEADLVGDPARYSEQILRVPAMGFNARTDGLVPARRTVDTRRIAVPAIAAKLTPPFMRALKAIDDGTIEWHFFPNQEGLDHAKVDYELRKWFPRAYIYPRSDYQTYLDRLAACSLSLDPFPFGGTNSLIDSLLCGVPIVTLEGNELSERVAASFIRRFAIPEELFIAHDVDGYVRRVKMLLDHPFTGMPSVEEVERVFFTPKPENDSGLVDAIYGAYLKECEGWAHRV